VTGPGQRGFDDRVARARQDPRWSDAVITAQMWLSTPRAAPSEMLTQIGALFALELSDELGVEPKYVSGETLRGKVSGLRRARPAGSAFRRGIGISSEQPEQIAMLRAVVYGGVVLSVPRRWSKTSNGRWWRR
jgi:hypothetical protein